MADKTPVPAVKFDPSRHVIAGRDAKTGVQKFFALSEIVAAEKAIEDAPSSAAPEVTKEDLDALKVAVHKALADMPPPKFPADLMDTFAAMTQTILALTARIQKLEADNAVFTENFAQFKAMTGAGA